jgi:hypothetical protein
LKKNPYELLRDEVYSILTDGEKLRITKFSKELNPEASYHLTPTAEFYTCNCPASNRGPCKHLDIVDAFSLYPERISKGWFYCNATGDWFPPIASPVVAAGGVEDVGVMTPASTVTPEVEQSSAPSGVIQDKPFRRF